MKNKEYFWPGFLCLALFCGTAAAQNGAQNNAIDAGSLGVTWRNIENNYQDKTQFLSAFTLVNKGKKTLPARGWSLYFNFYRLIDPATCSGLVTIGHLGGGLFRLSPAEGFRPLAPGDSIQISFASQYWVVNKTDAPAGLYMVWDQDPSKGTAVTDYHIVPSVAPAQLMRFPKDKVPAVTPASTFLKNADIRDIPAGQLPTIFPTPVSYKETGGSFTLDEGVAIVADKAFAAEAAYLARELPGLRGTNAVAGAQGPAITLQKTPLPPEAYRLKVWPGGILIAAGSASGIFYGIQSLRSLLPPAAATTMQRNGPAMRKEGPPIRQKILVPCVEVEDAPRFAYRSLMIDVARNFQAKGEVIRMLDLMALYKMNTLHLHFSDDEGWRLEIPGLPELTETGARRGHTFAGGKMLPPSFGSGPDTTNTNGSGYYTRSDFIEILKYATERHIAVIPEIESPGHARAAIRAMDARYGKFMQAGNYTEAARYLLRDTADRSVYRSAQMWQDNVMDPALPSTYRFMEKVVDEIRTMYEEAGAALATIHIGGDEVPSGVWERSPACNDLIKKEPAIGTTAGLWHYYLSRVNTLLQERGLSLSGWEEVAMQKGAINKEFGNDHFQVHVWNNFIGSGGEDLPYRLANAGYKVVLAGVTNFYFDMAYEKAFDEPGYYWGAYIDVDKPFGFIPYDYLKNTREDNNGRPLDATEFSNKESLTDYGKSNIMGIQGLVWGETVKGEERLEFMLLPRLLGVAERAWAKSPDWATEKDTAVAAHSYREAWNVFINVLGKRELPRLDHYAGGFRYRIPAAGARVEAGKVVANVQLPGFIIRYTTDGGMPGPKSRRYTGPIAEKGLIRLAVFSPGGRQGRTVEVENKASN